MRQWRIMALLLACGVLAFACRAAIPESPTVTPSSTPPPPASSTPTHTPQPTVTPQPVETPQATATVQMPTSTLVLSTATPLPATATPASPTPSASSTAPGPERIAFAPGETSATVVGEIERTMAEGVTYHPGYLAYARAGQTMEVIIDSPNDDVLLDVISADGVPLKRYVDGQSEWRGTLYATEDYFLQPVATGASAPFTLTLRIVQPEPSPTPPYVAGPDRISFTPGETSAAVSGSIERAGSEGVVYHRGYLVRARAGQTMEVVVDSPNEDVLLNVIGADGVPLKRYVDGASRWEGKLYATQDYLLQPVATGSSTSFTLIVRIPPAAPSPTPPVQLERISVVAGESPTIISGEIQRETTEGVSCHPGYVMRGLARQVMEVAVDSPNDDVLLNISGADGVPLKQYADGELQWRGVLPATQDYVLQPVATGSSTSFTLIVVISPQESEPQRIQFAPGATMAEISGRFVASMPQRYVLHAQQGQRLTVMMDLTQAKVQIEGEDGSAWLAVPVGEGLTIPSLPGTQDYTITLSLPAPIGSVASYTVEVSVTGP
jgi:hypothetical protein